jgi:peptide/nickel transport system substrate-binding protein
VRKLLALAAVTLACAAGAVASATARPNASNDKIVYGMAAGISQLDPNTIDSAAAVVLQTLLWNGLTKWGPDMSTQPDLASKWRSSADMKTWWFTIRKGVRYHDGRAFTADDARANILRVLDPKVPSQERDKVKDIRSVRAINPYLLRIRLGHPNGLLPTALVEIKMSDTRTLANVNKTANGTGPFKLKSFVPDTSVTLVRNDGYWGQKAGVKEIDIVREPDPTSAVTALRGGKIDVMWQVPPTQIGSLQGEKGISVLKPQQISSADIWELDTASPPFDDVRARQALSYAMNRDAMVKAAYFGNGTAAPTNDLLSSASSFFDKSLPEYKFDLDKAKQLFDAAGVKPGTTFTFWALAGRRDDWVTMAQILQSDLKKIGLNLDIQRNEFSTWLNKFYPPGKQYPATIIANYFSMPPVPAYAFSQVQAGTCECNWKNAQFEALAKQVVGLSGAAQQKAYDQMQAIFAREVPVLVPLHTVNITAAQSKVKGAWADSEGNAHLEQASVS